MVKNDIQLLAKEVVKKETDKELVELVQKVLSNLDGELMKDLIVAFLTTKPPCEPNQLVALNTGNV